MRSRRSGLLVHLVVAMSCAVPSACGDNGGPPERLVDGSRAKPAKVELDETDEPTILTRVGAATTDEVTSCLGSSRDARGSVVSRVGVDGRSITVRSESRRALLACDSSARRPRRARDWCGHAYGRIDGGRLADPRVGLTCTTATGDRIGFLWIEPTQRTMYVAVRQHGFVEVYKAVAGVPVRVTTTRVTEKESAAAVEVSEHDARGELLRTYTLEARVAS